MTTRCSGLARAMAGSAVGSGWAPSMALCRAFSQAGANMPGLGGAAGATWVSAAALRARALEEPEPMVWVWPMPVPGRDRVRVTRPVGERETRAPRTPAE